MKGMLLVLWLIVIAPMAGAATITFRSGDHDGFARLVLDIPAGTNWRIGRLGDQYALELDPEHVFDTSGAFDRIPRDRLANVTAIAGTGRLAFDLACDCHISAFLFRPDRLVIDIIDGPAPADAAFETPLEEPLPTLTAGVAMPDTDMPRLGLDLLPDPFAKAAVANPRVTEAENAILQSLARAATQGLLDVDTTVIPTEPASPPVSTPLPGHSPDSTVPAVQSALSLAAPGFGDAAPLPFGPVTASLPGLSVQTVIDRDRPMDAPTDLSTAGTPCLDDGLFDLASWGDESGFGAQMAARVAALTTERDQFPDGAVEALAQSYLYFGFGREAGQVLELDGIRSPAREVLRAMAQVMDGQMVAGPALAGQSGCAGPVALWAALAEGSISDTTEPERTAIISAHRVLPLAVRGYLGTRVAQLFLDAGDPETAQQIVATSEGARDQSHPGETLTTAEIALQIDGPDMAIETLESLASNRNGITPEAVVALVDLSIAEARPVEDDLITLARSLRFEQRGTPAETLLGLAEFRALLAGDRYADALTLLGTDFGSLDAAARDAHATEVFVSMARTMPDAAFLEAVFGPFPVTPSAEAENALADRLLNLGFADEAARLVTGPADGSVMADRRHIRAKAAVAQGRFADAEAELIGINDADADAIRALIPLEPGVDSDAGDAPAGSPEIFWKAGAWGRLEQTDDPLLRAASEAMLTPPVTAGPDSSLADRQTLLEQSAATRTLAADLLARFVIDPSATEEPTN